MASESDLGPEARRAWEEQERRAREVPRDFYKLHRPANLFARHGQERAIVRGLDLAGLLPLRGRRLLDVGCGLGLWFRLFTDLGVAPADLAGIDLSVDVCRKRHPKADLRAGDARRLPWDDGRFDVVFQSLLFTSVLDAEVRRDIAREMMRVLCPRGALLWYDFAYDNPNNPHVRGVGRGEIRALFPSSEIRFFRVTLAPPIARRLVPISWSLASALENLRLLNSHCLAVIRPASAEP